MDKIGKYEVVVLLVLVGVLLVGVFLGGQYARQERRDGQVRADLRQLKHNLEMYYNERGSYPLEWRAGKYQYVVVEEGEKGALSWYVSGVLENKQELQAGLDEEYNIEWRITAEGRYEICGGKHSCVLKAE